MNTRKPKIDYSILIKYFKDKASVEEEEQIKDWLGNPENQSGSEHYLRRLWDDAQLEATGIETDLSADLDKVHHLINLKSVKNTEYKGISRLKSSLGSVRLSLANLGRIAAVLLITLMLYLSYMIIREKIWLNNQHEIVYNEIKCPLGAQSEFELPDGTTGNLNNGSTIRYPARFVGDAREVELLGEAYFVVAEKRQKPFIITTVGLEVKVLGTKLNVYSYPDESYQEITLESGRVELIMKEKEKEVIVAEMEPGQHIIYSLNADAPAPVIKTKNKDLVVIESKKELPDITSKLIREEYNVIHSEAGELYFKYTDAELFTGWTNGKLILRNDPMPKMLKRIERWYNVEFIVKDQKINEYTYWATFTDENLDQVLERLSLTGPIKFNKFPREKLPDGTFRKQVIEVLMK